MHLGFTFSIKCCNELNLDWRKTLLEILDSKVWKSIRIPLYWDIIHPNSPTEAITQDYIWLLDKIKSYHLSIVPIIGYRNALWPEIHSPQWVNTTDTHIFLKEYFQYINSCLSLLAQYHSLIKAIQVENEPFEIHWGKKGLDMQNIYPKSIAYIKEKFQVPIIITYGYKPWQKTFKSEYLPEDIIGLDFYSHIGIATKLLPIRLNMFQFPFYKQRFIKDILFTKTHEKELWITELQGEPWDNTWNTLTVKEMSWEQGLYTNSPQLVKKRLELMKECNVTHVYMWGVEWWYTLSPEHREGFYKEIKDISS